MADDYAQGGAVEGQDDQQDQPDPRQADLFHQESQRFLNDLPPNEGNVRFVRGLDKGFPGYGEAKKTVRRYTRDYGNEGFVHGHEQQRSRLYKGSPKGIEPGVPFERWAGKQRVPFYTTHTHPSDYLSPSGADLGYRDATNPAFHNMMIEGMGGPNNRLLITPAAGLAPSGGGLFSSPGLASSAASPAINSQAGYDRLMAMNKALGLNEQEPNALAMLANARLAKMGVPLYIEKRAAAKGSKATHEELLKEWLTHLRKHGDINYKRGGKVADLTDVPADQDDHPAHIPTRLVTSKKAVSEKHHDVDMESFRSTPKLYEKNVDLVRNYPNMRATHAKQSHDKVAEHFINHAVDNLLDLHDRVKPEVRARSKLWYDGARKIVDQWSKEYGVPDHSIAGVLAALSPQKDWFQNVSLAKRVLDAMHGNGRNFYAGFTMTPAMEKTFRERPSLNKPDYQPLFKTLQGKSLHDLDQMDGSPAERAAHKALWMRLHDETYNSPAHPLVTPEGGFGENVTTQKGEPAKVAWGSLGEIGKAILALEHAKNPEALSQLMGERHKVRNFYNNILNPNSRRGDVTIDTHAVAAALMRPLSGNDLEVSHNFDNWPGKGLPSAGGSDLTGIRGLYPLYAEAYRRAAKQRGVLPREMQSITWEAARSLFPDTFKTDANRKAVDTIWDKYKMGKITQKKARELIHGYAAPGGLGHPSWYSEDDGAPRNSPDQGELRQPPVRGQPARAPVAGGGNGPPGGVPAQGLTPRSPIVDHALNLVRQAP